MSIHNVMSAWIMLVYALIDVDSLVDGGSAQMIFRYCYPIGNHRATLQHNITLSRVDGWMDEKDGKHGKDGETERDEGGRRSKLFLMPQQCPGSPLRN
ncbi:uncharacterized protein EAF01_006744 [Botrytis porri]|uniref:uncharacterized protein n=1 Tax=Botrytis porri TaxID=87229 RepID=UPI001902650B|nr:uncharacterized protein EAF01_006744 [Botrytis porri]KAF7903695.1 hypothetical protein EAF01_006744 [Botrytis porri]